MHASFVFLAYQLFMEPSKCHSNFALFLSRLFFSPLSFFPDFFLDFFPRLLSRLITYAYVNGTFRHLGNRNIMSRPNEGEKNAFDNVSFNELIWIELYWYLACSSIVICYYTCDRVANAVKTVLNTLLSVELWIWKRYNEETKFSVTSDRWVREHETRINSDLLLYT